MNTVDKAGAINLIHEARRLRSAGLAGVEAAYRGALARDPDATPAAIELAEVLRSRERHAEALAVTAPLLSRRPAHHGVLVAHAETLKAAGDLEGAAEVYRRAADENPTSAVASHNLAGVLGDLARYEEAEALARKAMASGLDAPQTWLVLARSLQGLGRIEEGEAAFRAAIARNPYDADAQRELAQLLWMTTGDAAKALDALDQAIAAAPNAARLLEVKAIAAKFFGDLPLARATIEEAVRRYPADASALVSATHLAILTGEPESGLAHARTAVATASANRWTRLGLCEALLAVGEAKEAARLAEAMHAAEPLAQDVIAYLATAWRLLGDARYGEVYDYAGLVRPAELDTPRGWSSLPAFLSDLAAVLERQHVFRAHPFQQSLLNGSQIDNLIASKDPVAKALFEALAGPIDRTVQALGSGPDPVRSRNTRSTRYQGVWSVRLRAGGGRHLNHVHHKGWLSSACYIALPEEVTASTTREGWLTFGEPGIATRPALPPEMFVEPKPGRLVLFPSYMWHGVTPFSGEGHRLSVAFDLLPGRAAR